MKVRTVSILLFVCLVIHGFADSLIVAKDGKSVWATSARKDGEKVVYISRETGEEKSIPVSELDGVVPTVRRGKPYTLEEIQKYVTRIKNLLAIHPNLVRQLNQILQEWEALQRPDPEIENKIDSLANEFKNSNKDTHIYNRVTLGLGMIKYKDMQGKYAKRIDETIESIKADYLAVNFKRLENMSGNPKMGIDDFVRMKTLTAALASVAGAEEKSRMNGWLEHSRMLVYNAGCKQADSAFASGKSVDAYLDGVALLLRLKNEVAGTDRQKADIEPLLCTLRSQASKFLPAYDFEFRGYPLSSDDRRILTSVQRLSSMIMFSSIECCEQCLFFPAGVPGKLKVGRAFSVPLRFVFNQAQPKDREFGMVVMMKGEDGFHQHATPLPAFKIKDGHAEITFHEDFSSLADGFLLSSDEYGNYCIYMYLACRDAGKAEDDENWQAISLACRWRITP